jgi:hypothetical protein
MLATLRQRRYPREFRIAPPAWPPDLLEALERAGQDGAQAAPPASAAPARKDAGDGAAAPDPRLYASVATGLWRVRQTMLEPGTDEPLAEMRRGFRHLESTWDALAQAGVEIQDHLDAPFDAGLALKVIAFQPTPGLDRERVIETIKPSVYVDGTAIQMGEVIVGTPEEAGADEALTSETEDSG